MNIKKLPLLRTSTIDGVVEMNDNAKVGDLYDLDLGKVEVLSWYNSEKKVTVYRKSIWAEPTKTGSEGFIPLELFFND